jgi:hypothetical protein
VFTVILSEKMLGIHCATFQKYNSELPKLVVIQELELWGEL